MNITLRLERPEDYRAVEELTREAFWGSMDNPTCDGEHLIVHKLRNLPSFVPELDYVAEVNGQLAGHIIYSLAKIVSADGTETKVLNFGPISVLPKYKRMGIGSALLRHTIYKSQRLGYKAIVFYGHPDYYPRLGFRRASEFGITSHNGKSFDALMAMPLYEGALADVSGVYIEDPVFQVNSDEMEAFDQTFEPKEPVKLIPINILTDKLSENIAKIFAGRKISFVSQLQHFSGAEMLRWGDVSEQDIKDINCVLKELSQPEKLLPTSPILKLASMGVQIVSLKEWPERLSDCLNFISFNVAGDDFTKQQISGMLCSPGKLPQGYFMFKNNVIIGFASLVKSAPASSHAYGNCPPAADESLSPWISILLVAENERRNGYGKLLLENVLRKARSLGFSKVYAAGDCAEYYEKNGFYKTNLTAANGMNPTPIYAADTLE